MGADDANEGFGGGECLEHEWVLEDLDVHAQGADMIDRCIHCGALAVDQSARNDPYRVPLTGRRRRKKPE